MDDRLAELKQIAVDEEGEKPSEFSERDLRLFAAAFGEPLAIFLLENGNYRARWHNDKLSTSVEFQGSGRTVTLHLPRATLTAAGREKLG